MTRLSQLALAALPELALSTGTADAARPLLSELLARPPAAGQPAMSALALGACLRQALELDRTGVAINTEIAAIDRSAAQGVFRQNQINAELPVLGDYDQPGLKDFQGRLIRHEQPAKKFRADFPLYKQKQKVYDAAVADFDHDCAQGFAASDLAAAKAKLGIK
ncbi:MAG TPA: hypothetical protein VFC45_12850 [Pseudolabrys sp.]|nr:hypothetical protein [Pseudolabrys sp.]